MNNNNNKGNCAEIQDLQFFGEFGGVNPSIADSSTFTYLAGKTMGDVFEGTQEGCYLYSRHTNPSTSYLGQAIAGRNRNEQYYQPLEWEQLAQQFYKYAAVMMKSLVVRQYMVELMLL